MKSIYAMIVVLAYCMAWPEHIYAAADFLGWLGFGGLICAIFFIAAVVSIAELLKKQEDEKHW